MKYPDVYEDALLRLRNHISLNNLANLVLKSEGMTSETKGKLATFLRSLDDNGLGSYVEFLNMREDIAYECKELAETFGDLSQELEKNNDLD